MNVSSGSELSLPWCKKGSYAQDETGLDGAFEENRSLCPADTMPSEYETVPSFL
jgi:hypothetical protein